MVRQRGFEPPRGCPRQPLKLVRLPIPPLPHAEPPSIAFGGHCSISGGACRASRGGESGQAVGRCLPRRVRGALGVSGRGQGRETIGSVRRRAGAGLASLPLALS